MVGIAQIKTLVLVADRGSFAAAARELGLSAAAVSKQLILLQVELGLQLMIRTTRSLKFTDVGKSYCEQCRRILEEVDVATALVGQMKAIPSVDLKVVTSHYFASEYIIPYLDEFLLQFPDIRINVELSERMPDFDKEAVDILIGSSIPATGNVIQRRIATTKWCFCASPEYLDKYGTPKAPKDLVNHQHIVHSMRDPSSIFVLPNKKNITVKPYICVNDSRAMVSLALKNLGIIKAHYPLVHELLQQKKLVEILSSYIEQDIPLYVAFPQRRYVPSKVRCFIDFILTKIE